MRVCMPQSSAPWWRHQMEIFAALLAICATNSPVPGEFPSQRAVTRSFDVFFDLNAWVNNRGAGDLRRHPAHYDVIVMLWVGVPETIPAVQWIKYGHDFWYFTWAPSCLSTMLRSLFHVWFLQRQWNNPKFYGWSRRVTDHSKTQQQWV